MAQWTDARHVRGIQGERAVLAWLTSRGWLVEAHRFRAGRHDVDLIARRDNMVAFVEVKTRTSDRFGPAQESVGWRKRRALAWVAEVWRSRFGLPGDIYRFDVAVVTLVPGRSAAVSLVEDAWRL
jgi:putative endonuclease